MERSPAAQALIDCAKRLEEEHNALKYALEKIRSQPNCRYEVEAQLGEEIWDVLHSAQYIALLKDAERYRFSGSPGA